MVTMTGWSKPLSPIFSSVSTRMNIYQPFFALGHKKKDRLIRGNNTKYPCTKYDFALAFSKKYPNLDTTRVLNFRLVVEVGEARAPVAKAEHNFPVHIDRHPGWRYHPRRSSCLGLRQCERAGFQRAAPG